MIFGFFFKKNLAVANGLATSGSGLGSFVLPYVMLYLLEEFSVQGCLLILGGIGMNICVFASLLRPFSFWVKPHCSKCSTQRQPPSKYDDSVQKTMEQSETFIEDLRYIPKTDKEIKYLSSSVPCLKNEINRFREDKIATNELIGRSPFGKGKLREHTKNSFDMLFTSIESIPASVADITTKTIKISKSYKPTDRLQQRETYQYLNWTLLKDLKFHTLNWGIFCALYGHQTLYNFVPAVAEEYGFSDIQGTIAVSVVGVFDLVGRISTGFVSTFLSVKKITVYRVTLLLFCFLTLSLSFATNFVAYVILCGLLGLTTGGYCGIQISMLIEELGKDNLSSAWGYVSFTIAVSLLLNPFISGECFLYYYNSWCKMH